MLAREEWTSRNDKGLTSSVERARLSCIEGAIMAKITVECLLDLGACEEGISAFQAVYPKGLHLSDWTLAEQIRVLKTDLRKYLGWGWKACVIPMLPMEDADLTEADLTEADLSWANLSGANLSRAKLTNANLRRANLTGADLTGADLTGADLSCANLTDADLTGAYLSGANLIGANLTGANLKGANLSWADLTGANLEGANLEGANLGDWERGQDGIAQNKA